MKLLVPVKVPSYRHLRFYRGESFALSPLMVLRGGLEPPSKPYKDSALTFVLTEYMLVDDCFFCIPPDTFTLGAI